MYICHKIHCFVNLPKYLLKMIYKRQIPKYANYLFACGQKAGEYMFGSNQNFKILNNAIDVDKYLFSDTVRRNVRSMLGITENQLLLGHIGRFSKPKNHEFLISVFQKVYENNHNARLLLVGDGVLFETI